MSIPTTFNPLGTGGNSISFIRYPEYNRFDIAVSSGGVYEKLSEKLPIYTVGSSSWDLAPTENSTNPVTSGGIYNFVEELRNNVALQGRNNTFTQTNTFNGAVALNGTTTKPASAEVWTANTIMTLGMHQVGAWWDELEANMLFNPAKTEISGNALMLLEGTTDAVQVIGVDGSGVGGKGITKTTGLRASDLVAGRITLNPRAQVKIAAAGNTEDNGANTAFASNEHPWLWITWHKNYRQRDINLIGAYAAANSCPVVLVCDSSYNPSSTWASRPITTKIVDAYLCSAPARNTAAGEADTVCLVLVGAKNGITDLYIGFKGVKSGDKRLMRHYTMPEFGFGEIGTISNTGYLPSVTASRGNLAASGAVTHKMDMWAYQGAYQPSDPAGSAAFFVKDAQTGMLENSATYDMVQTQRLDVYLGDVQAEQPSEDPGADYTFSTTPHDNKDDVLVPATGGYVLAKIYFQNSSGLSRYATSSGLPQATVLDSWLVDTEAGADEDGHIKGKSLDGVLSAWTLSKKSINFDTGYGGNATLYAYIKVPENTTGAERDGYAVVGMSGMRASVIHIVQAAE